MFVTTLILIGHQRTDQFESCRTLFTSIRISRRAKSKSPHDIRHLHGKEEGHVRERPSQGSCRQTKFHYCVEESCRQTHQLRSLRTQSSFSMDQWNQHDHYWPGQESPSCLSARVFPPAILFALTHLLAKRTKNQRLPSYAFSHTYVGTDRATHSKSKRITSPFTRLFDLHEPSYAHENAHTSPLLIESICTWI